MYFVEDSSTKYSEKERRLKMNYEGSDKIRAYVFVQYTDKFGSGSEEVYMRGWQAVNNPRLKSRACESKPWLTSLSAKSTTLRENI